MAHVQNRLSVLRSRGSTLKSSWWTGLLILSLPCKINLFQLLLSDIMFRWGGRSAGKSTALPCASGPSSPQQTIALTASMWTLYQSICKSSLPTFFHCELRQLLNLEWASLFTTGLRLIFIPAASSKANTGKSYHSILRIIIVPAPKYRTVLAREGHLIFIVRWVSL